MLPTKTFIKLLLTLRSGRSLIVELSLQEYLNTLIFKPKLLVTIKCLLFLVSGLTDPLEVLYLDQSFGPYP